MKRVFWLLIIALCLGGYGVSKHQLDERVKERASELDIRYFLPPEYVRVFAFGYDLAAADIFWIEGVNYFGAELLRPRTNLKYLENYTELILHLDPNFQFFYDWASTAFVYNRLGANRERLVKAIRYANLGIQNMFERRMLNPTLLQKGAFNYGLEAQLYLQSVPYFSYLGRSSREHRDMLLIASTYALYGNRPDWAARLREEYLAYASFEAPSLEEYRNAIYLLTSPQFNARANQFIRQLRVQMERDRELRETVERRLQENPVLADHSSPVESASPSEQRLERILQVDIERNWLPPKLHLLLNL
ncbi:MAG: hypothetical protein EA369_07720 [Bradymonadales bacterium]|nr:MAG: hypothetical protein EA369_07720 [Bradymonadales bacterium]